MKTIDNLKEKLNLTDWFPRKLTKCDEINGLGGERARCDRNGVRNVETHARVVAKNIHWKIGVASEES